RILERKYLVGNSRTFPRAPEASGGRKISWPEIEDFDSLDFAHFGHLRGRLHGFDYGHDEHMLVSFSGMLGETQPPTSRAFRSDAPPALAGITRHRHDLAQLGSRLDPRHHHAIG